MQSTFSELEYCANKKLIRREWFLAEIEALMPWSELQRGGVSSDIPKSLLSLWCKPLSVHILGQIFYGHKHVESGLAL